jgi:hypothetical protein
MDSLQLRLLGFGLLQDGNVRIGVFPEGEKDLVSGERPDAGGVGVSALRSSCLQGIRTRRTQTSPPDCAFFLFTVGPNSRIHSAFRQLPRFRDTARWDIAIGDVSGKGIGAALLMASLQASLRAQALHRHLDLPAIIGGFNHLVHESSPTALFASLFYAEYEPASRRLQYVNAGHNPPISARLVTSGVEAAIVDGHDSRERTIGSAWYSGRTHS